MQILRSKIYLLYRNEHLEVIIQKMKDLERVDEFMDDAKRAYWEWKYTPNHLQTLHRTK